METISTIIDTLTGFSAQKAQDLNTLQVCVRAIVVYLVLIGYVRFAKKRFLGRATGFDAILVIIIGSIASRAISGTAPFVPSLAGTFILVLFHWCVSYVTEDRPRLSALIKGRDTVLVKNGRVDRQALKAAHMSEDDLYEDLREKGIDAPALLKEARLERSGRLSVIKETDEAET